MAKASRAGDAHANTPELKNGCVLRVLEAWREEPRDAPRMVLALCCGWRGCLLWLMPPAMCNLLAWCMCDFLRVPARGAARCYRRGGGVDQICRGKG